MSDFYHPQQRRKVLTILFSPALLKYIIKGYHYSKSHPYQIFSLSFSLFLCTNLSTNLNYRVITRFIKPKLFYQVRSTLIGLTNIIIKSSYVDLRRLFQPYFVALKIFTLALQMKAHFPQVTLELLSQKNVSASHNISWPDQSPSQSHRISTRIFHLCYLYRIKVHEHFKMVHLIFLVMVTLIHVFYVVAFICGENVYYKGWCSCS